MKAGYLVGGVLAAGLLAGLIVWAAGDSGDVSAVRTQKGLSVGAATQGLAASEESDTATGVPAAQRSGAGAPAAAPLTPGVATDAERYGGAPLLQQGGEGLTVQGYGSATSDADAAIIEFYFSRNAPAADTGTSGIEPGFSGGGVSEPAAPELQEVAPITEAELQPVIDAIVAAGIARDQIEFLAQPYFDKFYSSATLRVNVANVEAVDGVVAAGSNAAAGLAGIVASGTNVSYTVNDCAALEEAAMRAAVEDANERAGVFARALGVGVGPVVGASNYSYFGGTPCDPGFAPGPYPLAGVGYAEGQPRQVQVIANISVTYAMQ